MGEGKEYVSRSDELGNIHIAEEVLAVIAAAAALVAGLVGIWFMLAYSYVYINCAVFPVAGALIAYAYDVAERTVAARKECCRKVETRRAYRAARASEYGA